MKETGKTVTEKIVEKASGKEAKAGDFVRFKLGNVLLGGLQAREFEEMGVMKVFDPNRVKIVVAGHSGVADNLRNRYSTMRLAKKLGVPRANIIDLGSGGVEHQVSIEHGWALPGTIFMCGTDGQTPIHGSMGCVAEPLAHGLDENTTALITGKSWIHVPPSMKFNLHGTLQDGVNARDVSEWILGKIGPSGCMAAMMELTGSLVENLSVDERVTLCCNAAFTGAFSCIVNPDKKTVDYVKSRTKEPFEPLTSDRDAKYVKTFDFDFSSIDPQIAVPPKRHTIKPVKEVAGKKVDRGYIGACADGRIEDMRLAARILKGSKVHPDVQLNVTPATTEVLKMAMKEGLIDIFIDAGAVLASPCCGMCIGGVTPLAGDEVCLSTSTCNYPSRMGSEDAQIYLCNPATVAASMVAGKIVDPREYL